MNVIVIVCDSLRTDHVGCYGSKVKTPNIDAFAQDSAQFTQSYSENLPTLPCRTAWWTGQYLFPQRGWQPFAEKDLLLAEVLWEHDVVSALVTDTYHMHKPVYNCGRGFDTTVFVRGQEYDPWVTDESIRMDLDEYWRLRGDDEDGIWRDHFAQYFRNRSRYVREEDFPAPRVVKEAIRWLEYKTKTQKEDLFLWLDMFDPHEPWDPPEPYRSMYDPDYKGQEIIDPVPGMVEGYMTPREVEHTKALYAGEITFVDKWVGILLDRIRDLGLYDNSLIIFTSDHGEPFGEHGFIRKAYPRGYEELASTPLLIRHPEGYSKGKKIDAFIQPPDFFPTILECMNVSTELTLQYTAPVDLTFPQDIVISNTPVQILGKSLVPLLKGETKSHRDFAITAHHTHQWVIRTEDYAFHYHPKEDRPNELYDRRNDRVEKNNIMERESESAGMLESKLKEFVRTIT
ncbi:MAG: sulfatase [bacterium]